MTGPWQGWGILLLSQIVYGLTGQVSKFDMVPVTISSGPLPQLSQEASVLLGEEVQTNICQKIMLV